MTELRTESGYTKTQVDKIFKNFVKGDLSMDLQEVTIQIAQQKGLTLVEYLKLEEESYIKIVKAGVMTAEQANRQLDKELPELQKIYVAMMERKRRK